MTAPTPTAYNFAWGFSDPTPQLQPAHYTPAWKLLNALDPSYWRIEIPWGYVTSSLLPGPYQGAGSQRVTATITGSGFVGSPRTNGSSTVVALAFGTGLVIGTPPEAKGRDWSYIDCCINDIRLNTGADIILVITQSRPSGWNAAIFSAFCVEAAQRYGPGGPGIRTDGIYAPNAGWGVTHWEMWNEQNNEVFWTANVNPTNYANFLKAGYIGIKQVQPGSRSVVLFGGMQHVQFVGAWYGAGWVTTDEFTFLRQCYASASNAGWDLSDYFDAMATHLYPATDFGTHSNTVGSQALPCSVTTGSTQITAFATGSGKTNVPSLPNHGRLQCVALGSGTGTLEPFQPSGPAPSIFMDNFRQIQGIYALMQANGDGAKGIWITEMGYSPLDTTHGITPQLMSDYSRQCWNILSTLPYIAVVLMYNALDVSNATTDDNINGYGVIDANYNPRPIYNWLLTVKPPLAAAGAAAVTATATGAGTLSDSGNPVITAVATGGGRLMLSGAYITFVALGSGLASIGSGATPHIAATAQGVGVVAITGSGGGVAGAVAGSVTIAARAIGVGKTGIQPHSNGDCLVVAAAAGTGAVGRGGATATPISATAMGRGYIMTNGAEIGVVGEVTGGVSLITAAATGTGMTAEADTGALMVTASITGVGRVGIMGAGTLIETVTALDMATVSPVGQGFPVATALIAGNGQVALYGSGSLTVTDVSYGSKLVVYTDMGAQVETFTASGYGLLQVAGNAAPTEAIVASGIGVVALYGSGALSVAATNTSTGPVSDIGSGAQTVTALASGAGAVGIVGAGLPFTVVATLVGTNFSPFSVTTAQNNSSVPSGAYGAYVTLGGSGATGSNGVSSSTAVSNKPGGGGGAFIQRSLILASDMGPMYSFAPAMNPSDNATFTSGNVALTAGGGSGGTGGTATATGLVNSAAPILLNGANSGVSATNGAGSGGGQSNSINGSGVGNGASGAGGSTTGGGTGGSSGGSGNGANGGNSPDNQHGGGGGGGSGVGSGAANTGGNGGAGGVPGGGGGAGSVTKNGAAPGTGGPGGAGYGIIEWIGVPQNYNDGGNQLLTATATGAGLAGEVTTATVVVNTTITGSGLVRAAASGPLAVSALISGNGVVGLFSGGSLGVTALPAGSQYVSVTFMSSGTGGFTQNPQSGYYDSNTNSYQYQPTGNQTTTGTHTLSTSDAHTLVLVGVAISGYSGETSGSPVCTAKYGGVTMSRLGPASSSGYANVVNLFYLYNPPTGQQTITVNTTTNSDLGSVRFASDAYANAGALSTAITASGSGTSVSETVAAQIQGMCVQVINAASSSSFTSVSGSTRTNTGGTYTDGGGNQNIAYLLFQDTPGQASLSMSAAWTPSVPFAALAVAIAPYVNTYAAPGALPVTATATGAGTVGTVGAAPAVVTATIVGSAAPSGAAVSGSASPAITASITGAGQEGDRTGGVFVATSTAAGAGVVATSSSGVPVAVTAAASGTGTVAAINAGSGSAVVTATIAGIGREGDVTGGQCLVTATGTGTGFVAISSAGGSLSVTATASGASAPPAPSVTFSGNTTPTQFPSANRWSAVFAGDTAILTPGDIAVTSGLMQETAPTATTPANSGQCVSGRVYQNPMATVIHWSEITLGPENGTYALRSSGVGVAGSDSKFTNGVFSMCTSFASRTSDTTTWATQIYYKLGSATPVQVASLATGWSTGDKCRLTVTYDGTNYTYTIYKNVTTFMTSWTDTSQIITPGLYVTPAFGCAFSYYTYYPSDGGATAFSASG